tara:strand:- start:892 stop:1116 length:225 start_codon:yes stop_codon:yes gene_type:complete
MVDKPIEIDTDSLSVKGKLHSEQYQALKLRKVKLQLEIEQIDVLMSYYEKTIPLEINKEATVEKVEKKVEKKKD